MGCSHSAPEPARPAAGGTGAAAAAASSQPSPLRGGPAVAAPSVDSPSSSSAATTPLTAADPAFPALPSSAAIPAVLPLQPPAAKPRPAASSALSQLSPGSVVKVAGFQSLADLAALCATSRAVWKTLSASEQVWRWHVLARRARMRAGEAVLARFPKLQALSDLASDAEWVEFDQPLRPDDLTDVCALLPRNLNLHTLQLLHGGACQGRGGFMSCTQRGIDGQGSAQVWQTTGAWSGWAPR
jgi:hypothetical protein